VAKKKKRSKTHSIQIEFSNEKVTSFGGLVLEDRLARRLGVWSTLERRLPQRAGKYSWVDIIKACTGGLLSGSRGTFATQELRQDEALLEILGLDAAPEEATFWRALKGVGELLEDGVLSDNQCWLTQKILSLLPRRDLLECEGFFPIFADGSLLEGSARREGTKRIKDKGTGLLWTTIFTGPFVANQALAKKGEGERSLVKGLIPQVQKRVIGPLNLTGKVLFLADSLHGNEPALREVERQKWSYVVGGGALKETERLLRERSEAEWIDTGADPERGWSSTAVCQCWVQCKEWGEKRLLVGRRVTREGEMFPEYYGVLTNLTPERLGVMDGEDFLLRVWRLYDAKGRMELGYKDLLSDLNLHHPPCREQIRNAGFYAMATLAHTLAMGVKLIGESSAKRQGKRVKQGATTEPGHARPRRGMRLWRIMRRLFALPARVVSHARRLKVTLLGVSPEVQAQFQHWYEAIARC
jgi:hypothetical protein